MQVDVVPSPVYYSSRINGVLIQLEPFYDFGVEEMLICGCDTCKQDIADIIGLQVMAP